MLDGGARCCGSGRSGGGVVQSVPEGAATCWRKCWGRGSTGRVRTHVKYDDALSDGEFDDIVTILDAITYTR